MPVKHPELQVQQCFLALTIASKWSKLSFFIYFAYLLMSVHHHDAMQHVQKFYPKDFVSSLDFKLLSKGKVGNGPYTSLPSLLSLSWHFLLNEVPHTHLYHLPLLSKHCLRNHGYSASTIENAFGRAGHWYLVPLFLQWLKKCERWTFLCCTTILIMHTAFCINVLTGHSSSFVSASLTVSGWYEGNKVKESLYRSKYPRDTKYIPCY